MAAGPVDSSFLWVADAAHISNRQFEDVFLVFNKLSGDTHILNFLSAAILDFLSDEKMQVADLAARIWLELELDQEDCPVSLIETTLAELDTTGLVTPVTGARDD
ncbi:HPr-rel-A system PqqD family peptide chaperone [Kordiimonas pumila]|uniref:HPr-rel-A system PqqD family peptide chaperone n=1 Tax=Kordiimonas pumila TaxID=2161677 RepID=A0ABV7D2H1_9PROT|nr:HPr-rel-A system PqqD family peptide chaperone [Kordiimonas pumila]